MFAQSQAPTLMNTLVAALLACLSTRPAAALLTTPTLHLFTAITGSINPNSTVSQFTEADFIGYAAVTLDSFSGPVNLPAGNGQGLFGEGLFIAGSGIVYPGQSILGYWIDDASTTLYLAEQFATPIPIVRPGDFLDLDAFFAISNITVVEN